MAELSWNTKSKFLEYIDGRRDMTNSSLPEKLEEIQKARELQKTLQRPPSRRWESFVQDLNRRAMNSDPSYPAASEQRRWPRSIDNLPDTHQGRSRIETPKEVDDYDEDLASFDESISSDLIRRSRSIDSTLLSSQGWNRSLFESTKEEDDNVMKMKLFRLMYESVKDSDLKIKRAELVKSDFENRTAFDLGYVCGDASDKLNVMTDISKTLKRMYDTWKPVEHVNAYEQIANLAIEVSHLIDMVRIIEPPVPGM